MKRRRLTRDEMLGRLPIGLRPKLVRDQVRDLGLVHHAQLDAISKGQGTERVLYELIASVFTWTKVAEMLHADGRVDDIALDLMAQQNELATRLVRRYGRTGRVGFDGVDYQIAKTGVEVMDELARITDLAIAKVAADYSETRINQLIEAGELRGMRATQAVIDERTAA